MSQNSIYLAQMKKNISLTYYKRIFTHLIFFLPTWYAFESKFASPDILTIIYAVSHLITVILELPTGALADLIGRKTTVFFGLIITGLSWIYLFNTQNIYYLWFGYAVNAIGVALVSGSDTALLYDSLKELGEEKNFSLLLSKLSIVSRIAIIIATFLGGYIYMFHESLSYLLVGICSIIAAFFVFKMTEPKIDSEKFNLPNYIKQTKLGFKQLFKNPYIKDFSIYYTFVGSLTYYFIYFLSNAYSTEIGFTAIERSWLYAITYIIGEIVIYFMISAKWVSKKVVYTAFPIIMLLGFLPAFFGQKLIAIACIFLAQLAASARWSILDQYSNLEFDSKYRATAISALNMLVSLVFSVIAIASGKIVSTFGAPFMMTLLGVVTLLTVVPSCAILIRNHEKK